MPEPSKVLVGKVELITDKDTKERVLVHKVYIEYPLDTGKKKGMRYVKTYCSLRMVRDRQAFAKHIQALIDMDAENAKNAQA